MIALKVCLKDEAALAYAYNVNSNSQPVFNALFCQFIIPSNSFLSRSPIQHMGKSFLWVCDSNLVYSQAIKWGQLPTEERAILQAERQVSLRTCMFLFSCWLALDLEPVTHLSFPIFPFCFMSRTLLLGLLIENFIFYFICKVEDRDISGGWSLPRQEIETGNLLSISKKFENWRDLWRVRIHLQEHFQQQCSERSMGAAAATPKQVLVLTSESVFPLTSRCIETCIFYRITFHYKYRELSLCLQRCDFTLQAASSSIESQVIPQLSSVLSI